MTEAKMCDWPAEMRAETLAAYLDIGSTQTFYRIIKKWPDFPRQNPVMRR